MARTHAYTALHQEVCALTRKLWWSTVYSTSSMICSSSESMSSRCNLAMMRSFSTRSRNAAMRDRGGASIPPFFSTLARRGGAASQKFARVKTMATAATEDLVSLVTLETSTIVQALRARHNNRLPYTMCRGVLISVNPHQWLPLYTASHRQAYMRGQQTHPHPYILAARALQSVHLGESHTLVITGESGAGKTEMAKICLDFVGSFAPEVDSRRSERIERILKSGDVLEYIGNAQTTRNHNSSRFGKFLRLFHDGTRQIGASIQTYLLERGRIANGNSNEGTFRAVYALLDDPVSRNTLALHAIDRAALGQHAAAYPSSWHEFQCGLVGVGFEAPLIGDIASIIAGVLFLLTRDFASASHTLGIDTAELTHALSNRRTRVMDETIWSECTTEEARQRAKALTIALYTRMFDLVVRTLNDFIGGVQRGACLNVLDIFGFESVRANGFEQLCINYCNERIQALFVDDVVVQQQLEYANEGVEWSHVAFEGRTRIVELCERVVFPKLDEATRLRSGAESFVASLSAQPPMPTGLTVPLVRSARPTFTIDHYAAAVAYDADLFTDRNTNEIRGEVVEVVRRTSNPTIARLFHDATDAPPDGKMWAPTIAAAFCEQVRALSKDISATHCIYIRCLRPNSTSSLVFDDAVVEQQIAANGIVHACKVMRNGFEHRMTRDAFVHRFRRSHARSVSVFPYHGGHWGKTMVYMSASCYVRMRQEEACLCLQAQARNLCRVRACHRAAVELQRAVRRFRKRTTVSKQHASAARLIQRCVRRHNSRELARWKHLDEVARLKAHILELRREVKRRDMWIFRAVQVLRGHRPDLLAIAPSSSYPAGGAIHANHRQPVATPPPYE